jgi:hypothetical protein
VSYDPLREARGQLTNSCQVYSVEGAEALYPINVSVGVCVIRSSTLRRVAVRDLRWRS